MTIFSVTLTHIGPTLKSCLNSFKCDQSGVSSTSLPKLRYVLRCKDYICKDIMDGPRKLGLGRQRREPTEESISKLFLASSSA